MGLKKEVLEIKKIIGYLPSEINLYKNMTVKEAKDHIKNGEFAPGSMLPKVEACIDYASKSNGIAIISSLSKAADAIKGNAGTRITKK